MLLSLLIILVAGTSGVNYQIILCKNLLRPGTFRRGDFGPTNPPIEWPCIMMILSVFILLGVWDYQSPIIVWGFAFRLQSSGSGRKASFMPFTGVVACHANTTIQTLMPHEVLGIRPSAILSCVTLNFKACLHTLKPYLGRSKPRTLNII